MDITRAAIERNRITAVALAIVILGGLSAYTRMPRAEDPGFIIRWATVVTYFPGASPERVESLVTDKLEKAIQDIPQLDSVQSESRTGVSIIYVGIREEYKDLRPIWDDLRRKVMRAASVLPDGVIGPTVNDEFGDVFGIVITITGEGLSYAQLKEVADEVRDELLRVQDVAKVDIYGEQEEQVFVEYSNARLAHLGVSPVQLRQILESRNIVIAGGAITTGAERIVLEPSGNIESVEDLRRTAIRLPGRTEVVYLEDLATVTRGYVDPPRTKMRSSGRECLGLAISMRDGGNIITLGENVEALIDALQGSYPIGVEFDVVAFQPMYVARKVNDFTGNLLQAVALVLVVMLAFLGLRTGLVVASLIPTAMIMSLLLMSFLDIGLDQMSLASLIIALGMLVDNAIVMAESIMVQMAAGKERVAAAVGSARELRVPLLISSLTTAAAFLPIYLAESAVGEYCAPLFKVVTLALLSSWILALTMTPLLCVLFLKARAAPNTQAYGSSFYRAYRALLLAALRRRGIVIFGALALFLLAMMGFRHVPFMFFPASDKEILTAEFRMPAGTPIERTDAVVQRVEQFMAEELVAEASGGRGVTNWATFIGEGGPRFYLSYTPEMMSPEYAAAIVNTTDRDVIEEIIPKLEAFGAEHFPELETTIRPLEIGTPVDTPVAVRLSGADPKRLFDTADEVKDKLRSIAGTKNVRDDWGQRTKKLLVNVDQARARRAGVTNQDIAISLQTVLSGFQTTEYREAEDIIPVILRSVAADRRDIGKLESLSVFSQATGRSVPLAQVADIEVAWEPAKILRRDRFRTVTVSCDLQPGVTATEVNGALTPWLQAEGDTWGPGYFYGVGGEDEESSKANESIAEKLPIAMLLIVLLLVGQFNSLRRPLIIALTIPLGLIGVVVGLLVARSYFGFMTLLGVIALAGIVVNNAIVLLDRIRIEIDETGLTPARAVVEAAQRRLRPILLTTATTAGGLLPLWLGGGPMWEPMAIAIIFGLLFATVLTLVLVPVLYSVLFRVKFDDFAYSLPERVE